MNKHQVFIYDDFDSTRLEIGEIYLIGLNLDHEICFTAHLPTASDGESVKELIKQNYPLSEIMEDMPDDWVSCLKITEKDPEADYYRWDDVEGFKPFTSLLEDNGYGHWTIDTRTKH